MIAPIIGLWLDDFVLRARAFTSEQFQGAFMAKSLSEMLEDSTLKCRTLDAPLGMRLSAFADDVRLLSPEFADIVDRMVNRLKQAGAGDAAPAVGAVFPNFVLPDQDGHLVGLTQLLDRGPVVVAFHRGHWCPYCRINAEAIARIQPMVNASGGTIVAITPELERFSAALKADAAARFPVLSDIDNAFALETNLAIMISGEKRDAMTQAGWDIALFHGNDSWMLPIPATFVVGTDQRVRARFVDPDYRKRMDIDSILSALRQ